MNYTQLHNQRVNPTQREPLPGRNQSKNDAGGYGWKISAEEQLMRFLILGTTSSTFYTSHKDLFKHNIEAIESLIEKAPELVLQRVKEVSDQGRGISNDPALFVLAMLASDKNSWTVNSAFDTLPLVARTGTHLFHFVDYMNAMRGWGRAAKRGIAYWYNSHNPSDLAFQVAKYQQRDGWSHRDIFRLAHPLPFSEEHEAIFKYIAGRMVYDNGEFHAWFQTEEDKEWYTWNGPMYSIRSLEEAKSATSEEEVLNAIHNGATLEMIPTKWRSAKVYETVLPNLGYTAILRNLANLSIKGVIGFGNWNANKYVAERLTKRTAIEKSRVHPMTIYKAMLIYAGQRNRKDEWMALPEIVEALKKAFYLSFTNIEPTGANILIGLDTSGSMEQGEIGGIKGLNPRRAEVALATVMLNTEPHCGVIGFGTSIRGVNLPNDLTLEQIDAAVPRNPEGTDCALPIQYAIEKNLPVDLFLILTDNETWAGHVHAQVALEDYRKKTGRKAKAIAVAMTAERFSIFDPEDQNTLNLVGFDASLPKLIQEFIKL